MGQAIEGKYVIDGVQAAARVVKNENILEPGTPVSFGVLCNEIKGLGMNIQLEKSKPV